MRYFAITLLLSCLSGNAYGLSMELGLGTRYTSFNYAEELSLPKKSTESVTFPAYLGQFNVEIFRGSYLQFNYEFIKDITSKYVGSDLTTSAPVTTENKLSFYNTEALLFLAISRRLTVYGGVGTYKWDRWLAGNPGYREIYSWKYQPTGVQIWFSREGSHQMGLDVSSRKTSEGKIKVVTSETVSGGVDSEMDLGARIGYRVSLPMMWRVGSSTLSTTPFFELSQIGESAIATNSTLAPTPGTGIKEPNSNTHRYGLELVLTFPL